jgi:hypothetical protein
MFNIRIITSMLAVAISAYPTSAYDCPSYEDIVQTSMEGYRAAELDGGVESVWYMAATNEVRDCG